MSACVCVRVCLVCVRGGGGRAGGQRLQVTLQGQAEERRLFGVSTKPLYREVGLVPLYRIEFVGGQGGWCCSARVYEGCGVGGGRGPAAAGHSTGSG